MELRMELIGFLILFPFVAAVILACVNNNKIRKYIVYVCSPVIIAAAIYFAVDFLINGKTLTYLPSTELIDKLMLIGEFLLMGLIIVLSFKYKKYYAAILSVVQTGMLAWLELAGYTEHYELNHIFCDRLTIIMVIIIAVVGSLICIYAVGYMTDYHNHHTEYKDRRRFFFGMLFVFLGAMFGLVFSSNLIWIYFFWEITSVSSFLLIGYTKTDEAIHNSFNALWMNLLGGLGFAIAIVYAVLKLDIINLQDVVASNNQLVLIPVVLLAFAGITKSAQLPFSRWLLGAMVAPTPTSALLHSATMVKAGVYLLIRLAPAMKGNMAGLTVSLIGGFTFFVASVRAMTHSDGKKILAYSTVSNLGLITACAGVGYDETVWAGIFLMMFHAVSKSLLFQTVGAVENATGSRDIENMHGLIKRYPMFALVMAVGICGMFLAPFGMLISKWAALKAFIDAGNIVLVLLLAFGSATTLFYWTKWLTKILAWSEKTEVHKNTTSAGQWTSLFSHATIMTLLCVLVPLISSQLIQPLLDSMYGTKVPAVLSWSDMVIMSIMIIAIFIVPFISWLITKNVKTTTGSTYMSGVNVDGGRKFVDSFGETKDMYLANWYLLELFGERKFLRPATMLAAAGLIVGIVLTIGGVL